MDNKNKELYFGIKEKLNIPEHEGIFRLMANGIVNVIEYHLEKNGTSRKQFAEMLGIKESQFDTWLSGEHNFTLKSLSKIQAALGAPVVKSGNALFNYHRLKNKPL